MTDPETLASARYIFTTGRRVHDRVQQVTTAACMTECNDSRFGELSLPQMNMIMMVRIRGTVSVTQLATLLGVSPPSVSTMVDRLVERGLLTRRPSSQDRRMVVIQVSPEAIEEISQIEEKVLSAFVELVEAVGPETARKWCEVLERIKDVLDTNQPR